MMKAYFTSLLVVLLGAQWATGCVYLMGESKDSVAAHPAGTPWTYGFRGNDWKGVDGTNASWTCQSGARQSPLNLFGYGNTPKSRSSLRTSWSYSPLKSNGTNIQVFNNGHTIQVQWLGALNSNVQVVTTGNKVTDVINQYSVNNKNVKKVQLTPLQFHFHTTSEHTIDGIYYPLEMHIVHSVPQSVLPGCPPTGCLSVTGIMFKLADNPAEDNPVLDAIWAAMPEREGVVNYMAAGKVLDLESLLPKNDSRAYMQYEGSLTTPPCTEGLLWHVLREPLTISLTQLDKYARSVGLKDCEEIEPKDSRRRLQSGEGHFHRKHGHGHGHSHSHAAASPLDRLSAFERGSYSGFVNSHELGHHARKLTEDKENAGNWNCTVVSFGFTNRNVQPINKRPILSFAKM